MVTDDRIVPFFIAGNEDVYLDFHLRHMVHYNNAYNANHSQVQNLVAMSPINTHRNHSAAVCVDRLFFARDLFAPPPASSPSSPPASSPSSLPASSLSSPTYPSSLPHQPIRPRQPIRSRCLANLSVLTNLSVLAASPTYPSSLTYLFSLPR